MQDCHGRAWDVVGQFMKENLTQFVGKTTEADSVMASSRSWLRQQSTDLGGSPGRPWNISVLQHPFSGCDECCPNKFCFELHHPGNGGSSIECCMHTCACKQGWSTRGQDGSYTNTHFMLNTSCFYNGCQHMKCNIISIMCFLWWQPFELIKPANATKRLTQRCTTASTA